MRSLRDKIRYGLLIDVGSGSIGFSIVASDQTKKHPKIIWERREFVPIRHIESVAESSKALISALTDIAMTVPAEGIKALRDQTGSNKADISEIQVTVAAPWSYTVSRKITYEQDDLFPVTNELIHDLAVAAGDEAMLNFKKDHAAVLQEVTETSRCVLDAYANGYRLPVVNKQETTALTLTHTTTLVYSALYDALTELNEKLFAAVPLQITSGILSFYYTTRHLKPHVYDMCLIDITAEATEIGIVRNGSVTYCTYSPFGTLALAREISKETDRPLTEVTSRLGDIIEQNQVEAAAPLIAAYKEKIITLFKETGDALSIPRTIYLLADKNVLPALLPIIDQAGTTASKTSTTVVPIFELLAAKQTNTEDYSIETAARFFHTTHNRQHFEYL